MLRTSCSTVNRCLPLSRSTMSRKRYWYWLSSRDDETALAAAADAGRRSSRCRSARDGRRIPAAARRSRGTCRYWSLPTFDPRRRAVAVLAPAPAPPMISGRIRAMPRRCRPARRTRHKACRALMRPKRAGVRLIAAHAIAPGTGRLDVVVVLAEGELGALELLGDARRVARAAPRGRRRRCRSGRAAPAACRSAGGTGCARH